MPREHRWFGTWASEDKTLRLERIDICKTGWFRSVRARTLHMIGWLPQPARKPGKNRDRYLIEVFCPREPEYMKRAHQAL